LADASTGAALTAVLISDVAARSTAVLAARSTAVLAARSTAVLAARLTDAAISDAVRRSFADATGSGDVTFAASGFRPYKLIPPLAA